MKYPTRQQIRIIEMSKKYTNAQIASILDISKGTVDAYLNRAWERMEVKSREESYIALDKMNIAIAELELLLYDNPIKDFPGIYAQYCKNKYYDEKE